jgi:hypothetical protein
LLKVIRFQTPIGLGQVFVGSTGRVVVVAFYLNNIFINAGTVGGGGAALAAARAFIARLNGVVVYETTILIQSLP